MISFPMRQMRKLRLRDTEPVLVANEPPDVRAQMPPSKRPHVNFKNSFCFEVIFLLKQKSLHPTKGKLKNTVNY